MEINSVLLIIPNLGNGGAQRVFRDQFQFYSKHFNVIGCVFNKDNLVEADLRLDILSLNVPAGNNLISKGFYFLLRVWKVWKIKKKNRVTHSISHLEGADYINILSARTEKVICWIHGTKKHDHNIEGGLGWIRKKILIPLLYRKSNRIICVSGGIRQELIEQFKINPQLIESLANGFDLADILQKAREEDVFTKKKLWNASLVLITHGRLARQKNLSALLEIFGKVKDAGVTCQLILIGDGELRNELIALAERLGLKSYAIWRSDRLSNEYDVYFMGYQSNPFAMLSKATLYVMTSSWEGFPLALGEAMACGVPVMSSDCFTGPREILAPLTKDLIQPITSPLVTPQGILMPLADSSRSLEIWANEIVRLLNDESQRKLLSEGSKHRMKDFDQSEINNKWLQLIHE